MENPTPTVTNETPQYKYIGPEYRTAISRDGEPYNPKWMSDEQIAAFLVSKPWAKEWFEKRT
jgi:hypothetical protein